MSSVSMRASDSERERIVRELTQHCGDGRLTLDELEERTAEAYAATSKDDLQHVLRWGVAIAIHAGAHKAANS